jgi:hypothetical protein
MDKRPVTFCQECGDGSIQLAYTSDEKATQLSIETKLLMAEQTLQQKIDAAFVKYMATQDVWFDTETDEAHDEYLIAQKSYNDLEKQLKAIHREQNNLARIEHLVTDLLGAA